MKSAMSPTTLLVGVTLMMSPKSPLTVAYMRRGVDAPDADLVLLTDYPTARALHEGRVRAQDALAAGLLKVQGRPEVFAKRADLLARLDDAFAPVRAVTTFPDGQ